MGVGKKWGKDLARSTHSSGCTQELLTPVGGGREWRERLIGST